MSSLGERLRVLLVEDSVEDATRVERELSSGGYDATFRRVETRDAFRAALDAETWDVVVSDHTLARYSGLDALADLRATGKDIPFLLVSGTAGEALAVAAMKAGAQDYVLKADLTRLPAAIAREVREAAVRADRASTREQLLISERMVSTGMLAAGVAHEINNPLAVALANIDFLTGILASAMSEADALGGAGEHAQAERGLRICEHLGEAEEPLRDAREALQRIRDIVRDVRIFSRANDEARRAVDVRRVIESSSRMAWNEIRHRARLAKRYDDVPPVDASESRIGQVVLNLLINAAHAIPEGDADRNEIRVSTRTVEDGLVAIEIADTGGGIPAENLERIFEPFFTTKPVGVGTGLGLAICRRIVTELGGRIAVESEPGKGTTFRILLPPAGPRTRPVTIRPPSLAPIRARVMIVDDERAVGRALQRSLAAHHEVVMTSGGAEAFERVAAGERYDAILSDLMMPQISGMELYELLGAEAPDQAGRLIFLTGGAFTPAAREFLDSVPNPRIEKPIELPNLLAIIDGLGRREA
jgi:signal transduction histidine kinase